LADYQRKDAFHRRAQREGYRSRAAYKLLEFQRSHRLMRPGQRVLDLGCWPGSWLQVAAKEVGARGRVVGVDLAEVAPLNLANAVAFRGDFTQATVRARLLDLLGGGLADVLLSDLAPKLSGVRARDRALEEELLETVEDSLSALLRPGGQMLVKLLDSPEAQQVARRLAARFRRAQSSRPRATRKGSSERYLLGLGLRDGDDSGRRAT